MTSFLPKKSWRSDEIKMDGSNSEACRRNSSDDAALDQEAKAIANELDDEAEDNDEDESFDDDDAISAQTPKFLFFQNFRIFSLCMISVYV